MWRKYRDLYAGGEQLKTNAAEYLTPRQKEPPDVYSERLSKVFYENYVGSIIDWYAATLFRREPVLHIEGRRCRRPEVLQRVRGRLRPEGNEPQRFLPPAADRSAGVRACHTRWWTFRSVRSRLGTGRRRMLAGLSRAYLVDYPAESLINWSLDARGNYEWVVLRNELSRGRAIRMRPAFEKETIWRYYDRTNYRVYRKGGANERRRSN